jgi:riboflavin synthase
MFTGIVAGTGRVRSVRPREGGARLEVEAGSLAAECRAGDSVAVNGACLTVVERRGSMLAFEAVRENLELPLRVGDRLDGHLVQGHVDGTGRLLSVRPEGSSRRLRIELPAPLARYVVEKGSVAVDGISLTVAALGADWLEVVIIPHTWEVTNLQEREPGARVNLEVDVLAKYVERLLAPYGGAPGS